MTQSKTWNAYVRDCIRLVKIISPPWTVVTVLYIEIWHELNYRTVDTKGILLLFSYFVSLFFLFLLGSFCPFRLFYVYLYFSCILLSWFSFSLSSTISVEFMILSCELTLSLVILVCFNNVLLPLHSLLHSSVLQISVICFPTLLLLLHFSLLISLCFCYYS